MKQLLIIFSLSLCLVACNRHSEYWETLSQVESYIIERPDSALVVLQGIDKESLSSDEERAKYALLMSTALDKSHVDITDDTLINEAVDYYSKKGDKSSLFKSYFYQGRVYVNAKEYHKAMLSYIKAEELIDDVNDYYAAGMLYHELGDIYIRHYDYEKSLTAFETAYRYYELAGLEPHMAHITMRIGVAHWNIGNHAKAEEYIIKALNAATNHGDKDLENACYQNLITLYYVTSNTEKCGAAIELLTSRFDLESVSSGCLAAIAGYYAYTGEGDKATEYVEMALTKTEGIHATTDLLFKVANMMKSMGDDSEALRYFEEGIQLQNTLLREVLQKPLERVQKDYFQAQSEYNALKLKHAHQLYIAIAIIAILLICVVALIIYRRITLKNIEIRRYMEQAQNLEESLFSKTSDMEGMSAEIVAMNEQINNLFEAQFSLIDKLSNTYYETHGTKRDKEAIYAQVRGEIEKLQTNKRYIQQLEEIVNRGKGNVMSLLRESMPEFSEMEFRLLCFVYAGFSAKAISVFTGDSIGNIYMKKSRLKAKIMQSEAPDKELLVKHMG